MQGGYRPGAGRKRGSKNRTTIEREINAAAVIDRARQQNRELAVDALERYMKIAEGAAEKIKPAVLTEGRAKRHKGDWKIFGEWLDRAIYCAKELANYQSPKLRAIMVASSPDEPQHGAQIQLPASATPTSDVSREKASENYLLLIRGGKSK